MRCRVNKTSGLNAMSAVDARFCGGLAHSTPQRNLDELNNLDQNICPTLTVVTKHDFINIARAIISTYLHDALDKHILWWMAHTCGGRNTLAQTLYCLKANRNELPNYRQTHQPNRESITIRLGSSYPIRMCLWWHLADSLIVSLIWADGWFERKRGSQTLFHDKDNDVDSRGC